MDADTDRNRLLGHLARRVRNDASFLASVLDAYKSEEKLNDEQLAAHLGISAAALTRLGLCRRPTSDGPDLADQLRQIAGYVGVDPAKLAKVVRRVETVEGLRRIPSEAGIEDVRGLSARSARGMLAAARDRTQPHDEDTSRGDDARPGQEGEDVDQQRNT